MEYYAILEVHCVVVAVWIAAVRDDEVQPGFFAMRVGAGRVENDVIGIGRARFIGIVGAAADTDNSQILHIDRFGARPVGIDNALGQGVEEHSVLGSVVVDRNDVERVRPIVTQ